MEVMLEIYRTLKALGMEWKEKRSLGGLGGLKGRRGGSGIERAKEFDGNNGVDLKAASGVYFVETRARVQDVVVSISSFFIFHARKLIFLVSTAGADELAAVHGRFHKLPRRFPS